MMECSSEAAVSAWVALLRAHKVALDHVEAALKRERLPPLGWYDVLLELERAGRGLRPLELEARMLLPQYGVSRLTLRMEEQGLVERRPHPDDGRGHLLQLTEAGGAMRRRMWPVYAAAIRAAIGERLTGSEAAELASLLRRLSDKGADGM